VIRTESYQKYFYKIWPFTEIPHWDNILKMVINKTFVFKGTFKINHFLKTGQVQVAHTCNPNYSGGRDQENWGSKPAQTNSSQKPISRQSFTKIGLVERLKVEALSSSPSTAKKKRKKEKRKLFSIKSFTDNRLKSSTCSFIFFIYKLCLREECYDSSTTQTMLYLCVYFLSK
jgi:hypothetical protein